MMHRRLRLFFLVGVSFLCVGKTVVQAKEKTINVEGLIYDLGHPEADRQEKAAVTLGRKKISEAVPALIIAARDRDVAVRLAVVKALVRINDPRALETYIKLSKDPEDRIQLQTIKGIVETYIIDREGFVQELKKFVGFLNVFDGNYNPIVVESFVVVSEDAVNSLAGLLISSRSEIRKDAAAALGILRARKGLAAIEKTLQVETEDFVKIELIRSIYKIGDRSAGRALVPLIRDPNKNVHDEAILTVGLLRVSDAVPELKALYELGVEERKIFFGLVPVTSKDDLQKKLLKSLARIGDKSCETLFFDLLDDERVDYRRLGIEGLGRAESSLHTTEVSRRHLQETSKSMRLAMSFALFRMGRNEHLPELIAQVNEEQAFHYLLEMGTSDIEKLYPYLRSENDSSKLRLLEIIGQRGDQSAVAIIQKITDNANSKVSSAANLALRRLLGRTAP